MIKSTYKNASDDLQYVRPTNRRRLYELRPLLFVGLQTKWIFRGEFFPSIFPYYVKHSIKCSFVRLALPFHVLLFPIGRWLGSVLLLSLLVYLCAFCVFGWRTVSGKLKLNCTKQCTINVYWNPLEQFIIVHASYTYCGHIRHENDPNFGLSQELSANKRTTNKTIRLRRKSTKKTKGTRQPKWITGSQPFRSILFYFWWSICHFAYIFFFHFSFAFSTLASPHFIRFVKVLSNIICARCFVFCTLWSVNLHRINIAFEIRN